MNFKERVLKIVRKIPRGKVLTYKKVAELAKNPRAFRAVGNILNKNRNSKIPCHRVIRSDGKIGEYNRGVKQKTLLLEKEGVKLRGSKSEHIIMCVDRVHKKSMCAGSFIDNLLERRS